MKTLENNFISVVAYIHNCGSIIDHFLDVVSDAIKNKFKNYEYIFVNDASDDNSVEIIRKFGSTHGIQNKISIVNMGMYQGIERSMVAGIDDAIGDYIYEFDKIAIDYSPDMICKIYDKALEGFDIVAAVPQKYKSISSKIFYKLYNSTKDAAYKLERESFRIISRRAINRVGSLNKSVMYRKAVYAKCGLKRYGIYYDNVLSHKHKTKYEKRENDVRISVGSESLILFTDIVEKFSALLSIIFLLFTIGIGLYTIIIYLGPQKPVEGYTPIMLFLSVGFTGLFLIITLMLKYLSVILNVVFKKKNYLVESIERINLPKEKGEQNDL